MLNDILNTTTISFLGRKGLGKTIGSSILINNINDKDVLVFDITGAYTDGELIKDAKYIDVNTKRFDKKIIIDILLKFKETRKIVLCLNRLTRKELVEFSEVMFKVLNEIGDVAVIIDEVGEIVSQQREYYSPELERCCRIGRNYNIRPFIVITQRTQKVDKNILALSDYYIIMGLTHNLDLEAVRELVGYSAKEFETLKKQIKGLNVGEFYLLKYDGTFRKGKFDLRNQNIVEISQNSRQKKILAEVEKEEIIKAKGDGD